MWVNRPGGRGGGPPGARGGSGMQANGAPPKCQRCLQVGHWTYECSKKETDRAYVVRPSRTQQLKNPKLAQKFADFTGDEPPDPKREYEARMDAILGRSGKNGAKDERRRKKRKHSPSSSSSSSSDSDSSSSDSDSDSDSSSSSSSSRRKRKKKKRQGDERAAEQ